MKAADNIYLVSTLVKRKLATDVSQLYRIPEFHLKLAVNLVA